MTSEEARHLRHELRTPVNHIVGYADLLLDEDDTPPSLRLHLAQVKLLAQQVHAATAGVLDDDAAASRSSIATLHSLAAELEDCAPALAAVATDATRADTARISAAIRRLHALANELLSPGDAPDDEPVALQAVDNTDTEREAETATILVVDDDEANREVLGRRLQRLGYRVTEARNGLEALEAMAASRVDLVLLDVMMPELDGYAVLERRRADPILREIPVIMISALDQVESVVRCIEQGAEDYLPKPFDPVLLQARIGACLEKKRLHDRERQLLETVTRQADELREWNQQLETRVAEKVKEVEQLQELRRFLSPQLAEVIVNQGAGMLASHRREITVLFCDLRGFTPFAETAEPEDVMAVIRDLHGALGPLIFKYEGTLERFTGDGMMVFFNDPVPCDDPAWRAVQLGLEMRDRSRELTEAWRRRGHQLELGIGISVGHATCGQIGFEGRYDYGAIGTVTNLSARLCAEAKGGQVLVSQRVYAMVEDRVQAELVGEVEYKGISRPVPTYSVTGLTGEAPR
jgi:adenylate cyclase